MSFGMALMGIGINRRYRVNLVAAPPVNAVLPSISGTTTVGETLTSTTGTWDGFATPTFAYQWNRDGTPIGSATSSTYVLVTADVGATITVTVTATNLEGSTDATSAGVGPVASIPVNTVLPVITGTTVEDETLTSTTGTWTGTPTPTYTYQWRRNGTPISGATSSTYVLVSADVGTDITVTVTGTNVAAAIAATSAGVGPITASGPARTLSGVSVGAFSSGSYPVTLTGDAVDGETVQWVLYSGTDPTLATEVAAGTWSGATVVDDGTFAWAASPSPITLVDNIAKANYKLVCIVDNGELSNLVISSAFEVDTTDSLLTAESFTDGGAEDVDWAFTSDEDVSYRVSLWADGSTPSAAEIESGTGSVATVTGTAAATVAETGTFASGSGTFVPTIWVSDDYGNEYTETYADVTSATAGLTRTFVLSDAPTSNTTTKTVDLSAMPSGAVLYVCINCISAVAANSVTAVTVQGDSATLVAQTGGNSPSDIWRVVLSGAGSGTAAVVVTRPTAITWSLGIYRVVGTVTTTTTNTGNIAASPNTIALGVNTANGGVIIGCAGGTASDTPVWTNITKDADTNHSGSSRKCSYASDTTVAATPRTVTYDPTPTSGSEDTSFVLVALS